jgi:hypothetical protein
MKEVLIETVVKVICTIVITAIGVFAAWLSSKLKRHIELKNVQVALETCLELTKVTVGELQQTIVDGLKEANADGKLTKDEIKQLNSSLVAYTKEKMSSGLIDVILGAGIDIDQFIVSAGENYVQELKYE